MRRSGSVHKTGGFRLSGGGESWTSPTLVSVRFASNRDSEYSHQGLRVLIFTDRPGPRAHLVGVYLELRDLFDFSSAVQSEPITKRREVIPAEQYSTVLEELSKKIPAEDESFVLHLDGEVTECSNQESDLEIDMEDNPVQEEFRDSNSNTNVCIIHPFTL
ncbi:hypothetical protein AVEN_98665-1 [Araneus ventricosus]|uniref:Uncharacterized protein n=1 Tax=Araneus ventricosus TaxID=182803 RepID=A0A4Y2TN29_ARAVE|nr:hypothetical protein AVEN_98665-1 [Araneus ventricosus]